MVISGDVKSLIINFSPPFVRLPGAVRSACVGASPLSRQRTLYMLFLALAFCEMMTLSEFEINSTPPEHFEVVCILSLLEDRCPRC